MTIETATYVTDLNTAYPATSDPMSQGDDHLRLIKSVVKSTWGALGNQPLATTLGDYLTTATASSTYLTQASAASTYLTQANATSTYLTQANAASTYETIANVALKADLASPTFTGTVTTSNAEINGELQIDGVVQMTPQTLTSSSSISLSMTGANKKTLSLAHNTTITVSGEVANQTVEVWITSTGLHCCLVWCEQVGRRLCPNP